MKSKKTAVKTTKSKYGIAVFTCDQCEFVSLYLSNLKKHKQLKHNNVELGDQDCDLESKIEIVDDMLAAYKTESSDLTNFPNGPTDIFVTEPHKESVVKNEEISEEDPLSDTTNLMEQDPLEVEMKQERIEDEQLTTTKDPIIEATEI